MEVLRLFLGTGSSPPIRVRVPSPSICSRRDQDGLDQDRRLHAGRVGGGVVAEFSSTRNGFPFGMYV